MIGKRKNIEDGRRPTTYNPTTIQPIQPIKMKFKVFDLDTGKWSDPFVLENVIRGDADINWNGGESSLPWKDFMFFRKEFGELIPLDLEEARKEIARLKGLIDEYEKQDNDPYWYWPQCDVDGCEGVSCCNGMGWRETGYWCLCSKHADEFGKGLPQPKMKDSAIEKERSRLPDGTLPSNL